MYKVCTVCKFFVNNISPKPQIFNMEEIELEAIKVATFYIVPRLFEEKRRDIVFGIPSFRPPNIVGTLCAQLLLQFYADSFETLQMFLSWSEDMHVVWILS